MICFLKHVFRPIYDFFWQKNQGTWNVGKIRNYDEERLLFRERKFSVFTSLLYKNERAQNMLVLAGPLVIHRIKEFSTASVCQYCTLLFSLSHISQLRV